MKLLLLAFLLLSVCFVNAQYQNDTLTIFYNHKKEIITKGQPSYVGVAWKEGEKWHKQDFYYPELKLKEDGFYADKDFKIKDGSFTSFHYSGMMSDSCFYSDKKRKGAEITWDEEGNQRSLMHWHNDLPVDTAIWWNAKGAISGIQITDSFGNGLYQQLLDDGKTIRSTGRLLSGKRTGKWIFKDADNILSTEAIYLADSAISVLCYNEKGELEKKNKACVLEKPAEFSGGANGWRRFLEKNLQYPEYAQEKGITGTVRVQFIVSKTGELSEFKIVSSPHESLSNEVLRLMKTGPNWEPALQYNRPVVYRQIQSITFQLQ